MDSWEQKRKGKKRIGKKKKRQTKKRERSGSGWRRRRGTKKKKKERGKEREKERKKERRKERTRLGRRGKIGREGEGKAECWRRAKLKSTPTPTHGRTSQWVTMGPHGTRITITITTTTTHMALDMGYGGRGGMPESMVCITMYHHVLYVCMFTGAVVMVNMLTFGESSTAAFHWSQHLQHLPTSTHRHTVCSKRPLTRPQCSSIPSHTHPPRPCSSTPIAHPLPIADLVSYPCRKYLRTHTCSPIGVHMY